MSHHKVELILSSEAEGVRIHTFRLRYWRAIHSEVMTHRVLSRNASSSRAIPVDKMLTNVIKSPAGPSHWGMNEKGMQAHAEIDSPICIEDHLSPAFHRFWREFYGNMMIPFVVDEVIVCPREIAWRFSAWLAASMSRAFSDAGYHKQVANRITEPYQYINVVVTSTEWENLFKLRRHVDAMPEFRNLAEDMWEAITCSNPQHLESGDWHIPFIKPQEDLLPVEVKLKLSTARCASVSYQTVEGTDMGFDAANRIYDKLVGSDPIHASPTEHQARVVNSYWPDNWKSNFRHPWIQYRKFIENEEPVR